MKNIVLIDVWANYLNSILNINDINIKMLVTENKYFVEKCKNIYGDKVENYYYRIPGTNQEFDELNSSEYNLTYNDIEKYRSTQLKCEHFIHREILDDGVIQYRYLTALKFWLGFFNDNKIDAIIDCLPEHGALWDSLILDIAKSKNIPVYSIMNSTGSEDVEINCLVRLNDKKFIKIEELELPKIDFDSFFETIKTTYKFFKKNKKRNININISKLCSTIRQNIKHCLRKHFISPYRKYKKNKDKFIYWAELPEDEIFEQYKYVKNLKKIYDKIAYKPNFNEKINYIYYPLHQEPESSIMARSTMTSQLFIINQITRSLPNGWKLYVKEHPSEFSVYEKADYFLRNIQYFRTSYFYNHIKSLPNVELIDINTDTKELILNSKCVCSICGTSLVEAAIINKPILIWGEALNFLELLKDSFVIKSTDDLKEALNKLYNDFETKYEDFDKIYKQYSFSKKHYEQTTFAPADKNLTKLLNFVLHNENI